MGQMVDDVRLAVNGERPVDFYGRTGGMVPTVNELVDKIMALAERGDAQAETPCDSFTRQVNDAATAIGGAFSDIGKKINDVVTSPEVAQKAEVAKEKLSSAASTVGQALGELGHKLSDALGDVIGKPEDEAAKPDVPTMHASGSVDTTYEDAVNPPSMEERAKSVPTMHASDPLDATFEATFDASFNAACDEIDKQADKPQSESESEQERAKEQLENVADKAVDGLSKGASFLASGLGKLIGSVKKGIENLNNDKGGEQ